MVKFNVGDAVEFMYHGSMRSGVVDKVGNSYVVVKIAHKQFKAFTYSKMSKVRVFQAL